MPLALMLDVLVSILLVVTICYAWTLNQKLGNLRRDKGELEKMALNFHMATDRAEESIARLKVNVDTLQENMKKAESLRDDLVFLSERGAAAADRLEVAVRAARNEAGVSPAPVSSTEPPTKAHSHKIPDSVRPDFFENPEPGRATLTAGPLDRAGKEADDKSVSQAERELLKALRSAG